MLAIRGLLIFFVAVGCASNPPPSAPQEAPLDIKPIGSTSASPSASAPPPATVATTDPNATILVPLEEDAGASGGKPAYSNLARLRQCCHSLSAEAKQLGASPDASVYATAAAQCNAMVSAVAPNGNAPELGVLRALLSGKTIPAVCAGF